MKSTGKAADPDVIERLAKAMIEAIEHNSDRTTNPTDAFSAIVTVLHRMLLAMRVFEGPGDRYHNSNEIHRALADLQAEHGTVTH